MTCRTPSLIRSLTCRVKSATAESYFVKAGDYIQILDVDGRQCTDFQVLSTQGSSTRASKLALGCHDIAGR
jgi:uncharacterized protein YcgI (DUF1989 family)